MAEEKETENAGLVRLQKYLAMAGVASRRHSEELIAAGRVRVNGRIVTEQGVKINPYGDKILLDDKPVILQEKKQYILLYKPVGYLSSVRDDRGRKTVLDLLPGIKERIYPVGRLDYDTEGLLLLTNDGEFTNLLIHPRHEIEKTYRATVEGLLTPAEVSKIERGIMLEDGMTAPARVNLVSGNAKRSVAEITIHEGRNRQVRRMFAAVGHPVVTLKRERLGNLTLGDLQPGHWRFLSAKEIEDLTQQAKKHRTGISNGGNKKRS